MLIGKEVLLLEKARRELRASEAAAHQVPSLHTVTTIESGEFVGKARRVEFRQTHPIDIAKRIAAALPHAAVNGIGIAQHALAGKMGHEVALQHPQKPVGMARLLEDFTSLSKTESTPCPR